MKATALAHHAEAFADACRTTDPPAEPDTTRQLTEAFIDVLDAMRLPATWCEGTDDRLGVCRDCGKLTRPPFAHNPSDPGCFKSVLPMALWCARRAPRWLVARGRYRLASRRWRSMGDRS